MHLSLLDTPARPAQATEEILTGSLDMRNSLGNKVVWTTTLVLSREGAVTIAVHEDKGGRKQFLSGPRQAPEKSISTAEHSHFLRW